jgi:hypothetical protein
MRCSPARGRNLAVERSAHAIIVSTDIGCDWDPEWLAELARPLETDPGVEAVMGSWRVDWQAQQTPWAQADPLLRGGLEHVATPQTHASNRAIAYRKALWQRVGGLPSDLTFSGDDMVFALLLHRAAKRVAAAPVPRCVWDRPQTFQALLKEARRNFRGSAEAGLWLDYLGLVGGRILVEWLGVAGLVLAGAFGAAPGTSLGWAAVVLLLLAWRVRSWLGFWRLVRQRGGGARLWQVAALDYATRLWALRGYLEGLRHGAKCCRECRQRVRAAGIGWWAETRAA